ncbi:uncharacterized protein [Eurosta solidaginis]|uniref:uncharacterized protein n=1 Tax=Eurosta solidaginis TaxID=178769 RepID=UPI00353085EA
MKKQSAVGTTTLTTEFVLKEFLMVLIQVDYTHLVVCIICGIVYIICFILEILSFSFLIYAVSSVCVGSREVSSRIWWSMNLIFVPIISDICFAIMGCLLTEPFYAPLGGCYNIVMSTLCLIAGLCAMCSYTGCGNIIQIWFIVVGLFEIIAAIIHGVFVVFVFANLDEGEALFSRAPYKS